MNSKFLKEWDKVDKESILGKIGGKIHHQPPLRERLSNSSYRIQVIHSKLERLNNKMEQKNSELFEKCTKAVAERDQDRATMYANECAQVKKMAKIVLRSQLALEQVGLRLDTVKEFGDVASEMGPLANVVHSLKGHLTGVMPEVSYELGVIGDTLNGLVLESGEASGSTWDVEASGQEATRILQDANSVAEQRMKDRFPDIPVPTATTSEKTSEFP
ncbi:MAG: Snf7 family protein [Candidatus Bathyarchaeota archaeon]